MAYKLGSQTGKKAFSGVQHLVDEDPVKERVRSDKEIKHQARQTERLKKRQARQRQRESSALGSYIATKQQQKDRKRKIRKAERTSSKRFEDRDYRKYKRKQRRTQGKNFDPDALKDFQIQETVICPNCE